MPRILIVEDNAQDRKALTRVLGQAGFEELTFLENGEEALNQVLSLKPDIVILDLLLPGINGFEVCRTIKQSEGVTSKVILTSGFGSDVDEGRVQSSGADCYLPKTSDWNTLVRAVGKLANI